jgi:hypothetical protein
LLLFFSPFLGFRYFSQSHRKNAKKTPPPLSFGYGTLSHVIPPPLRSKV